MPLCSSTIYLLLSLIFICASMDARSPLRKPERMSGSAQLALEDIRYIVVSSDSSDALVAALEDLVSCWPGELERREAVKAPSKQSLVLVRDPCFAYQLRRTGAGGFSFRRDRSRIYLRAASDEGLTNGIYAICRELLGARWYWPGELGFERVGAVTHKMPDRIWRERPAFVQRTLHPFETDFGRRNGLNRKYSFNHNLARIFTPEVYEASPEVFAEIGGERRPPRRSAKYDPQPDFTESKAVELAAAAALEHFRENPESNSFSLSINDNSLFDEGPETEAVVSLRQAQARSARGQSREASSRRSEIRAQGGLACKSGVEPSQIESFAKTPKPGFVPRANLPAVTSEATGDEGGIEYFRGRPNYTDLVFGFMNKVAEQLERAEGIDLRPEEKRFPLISSLLDKFTQVSGFRSHPSTPPYLTALAYYSTEQSPAFKIHPRVMPVLTSDRAQWHDPAYRAEDEALIQRWANSGAERIATWDYYYGVPMPYPRQMTHWMGESISYLHDAGIDVFFSKLPMMWGLDGPKAWLAAELLRDPEQDAQVLLDEFYTNFFGPAAEPMREFYEIAEQTRNEREGPANWIKFYKDEAGIELFPSDTLVRMRECIDDAEDKLDIISSETRASASGAPTKENRFAKRVQVVSEAFSYTESYAYYHRSRVQLVELSLAALRADLDGEALAQAFADYQSAKASFLELSRRLAEEPMHAGFKTFNRLMQSEPVALALAALARSDFDLEQFESEKASDLLPVIRDWHAGSARYVRSGKNPSLKHSGRELRNFLGPELPVIDAWGIQYRASDGLRVEAAEGADDEGLRIENADIVSLSQICPVLGERFYLLQIEAGWQVSPDNRTWIQINWESIGGEDLRTDVLLRLPNGTSEGSQLLQFALQAPANAYDLKIGIVTNRQYEGDYLELKRVELGELVPKR